MCNCLAEIKEKSKEKYPDYENISFVTMDIFSGQITIPIEITIKGKKKKLSTAMLTTFCPFCGEKYDKSKRVEV